MYPIYLRFDEQFQSADFLAKYPISVDDEPLQSQLMAEYYLSRIRLVPIPFLV